jgi:hypothetical protein
MKNMIEYSEVSGEVIFVSINGENLDSDDGESWHTPKALLRGVKVNDLPDGIVHLLCVIKSRKESYFSIRFQYP